MPPKWQDVVESKKFQSFDPDKQEQIRQRWINEVVSLNPHWNNMQINMLKQKTQMGVFEPAGETGKQIKPTDAIAQPAGPEQVKKQPVGIPGMIGKSIGKKVMESPTTGALKGYQEGGILEAAKGAARYTTLGKIASKWHQALAVLNAGLTANQQGLIDRRKELATQRWDKQSKSLRIKDIKETILNKGARKNIPFPIPFDFMLPDVIRNVILNGHQEYKTPEEIDKKLMDMSKRGELDNVPNIVPRNKINENDPLGTLGVSWKDYLTSFKIKPESWMRGFKEAMGDKEKMLSVSDTRKAFYGKTYEEALGLANGMAVAFLGDCMSDPTIVLGFTKQGVQKITTRVASGRTKNAVKELAGLIAFLKNHEGKAQRAAFKRMKERGIIKQFNLLRDSLEKTKGKTREGRIATRKLTAGAGKLKEAPEQKALPPGRKAIELPEAGGSTRYYAEGKEVTETIPARAAPEGAVHQAVREGAVTKGQIVRPALKEAEGEPKKALPSAEKKAIEGIPKRKELPIREAIAGPRMQRGRGGAPSAQVRAAGGEYIGTETWPAMKGKPPQKYINFNEPLENSTLRIHADKANAANIKLKIQNFQEGRIENLKQFTEDAGYEFDKVLIRGKDITAVDNPHSLLQIKDPQSGKIYQIELKEYRGTTISNASMIKDIMSGELTGKRLGSVGKVGPTKITTPVKATGRSALEEQRIAAKEAAQKAGAEVRGFYDEIPGGEVALHHPKTGSTDQVPYSFMTQKNIKKWKQDQLKEKLGKWTADIEIDGVKAVDINDNGSRITLQYGKNKKEFPIKDMGGLNKNDVKTWVKDIKQKPSITEPTTGTIIKTPGKYKPAPQEVVTKAKPGVEVKYDRFGASRIAKEKADADVSNVLKTSASPEKEIGTETLRKGNAKKASAIYDDMDGIHISKATGRKLDVGGAETITEKTIKEAMERGKKGDGYYIPSLFGGFQRFFDRKAVQAAAGYEGLKKWSKAPFSVVKPWNEIGKPKTGIAIKNIYSKSEEYSERGIQWMRRLSKEGKTGKWTVTGQKGYTNKDLSDIVLLAEDKAKFASLPANEKERLGKGVKMMREFFDWAKKEYKANGASIDFKQRMQDIYNNQIVAIRDIAADMKQTPTQYWERDILTRLGFNTKGLPKELTRKQMAKYLKEQLAFNTETLKRLDNMEYVHIPYDMWFREGTVNRAATLKALRIANAQKRKTIMIDDLIKAGAIDPKDINAFDIMASYTHRMSKDMAMLNVKKVAASEGLLSKTKLPGFQKMPAYDAPMFSDVYMHPAFKDWMYDFKFQTFNQNLLDKAFSSTKMWQFIKPLFLPYYDMIQGAAARAFSNPLVLGRDLYQAGKMMVTKNDEYFKYIGEGLASRPIDVPWNQFEDTLRSLKGTSMGDYLLKSMQNKNWTVIKPVYNFLWNTAWNLDRFVRLATANYFHKSLKMSHHDAAQLAALFHSDYANVPIATRRAMNKVAFTPTFKITMFRLFKEMGKSMVTVPIKAARGKPLTTAEKQLAKGGVAVIGGSLIGWDQLMTRGFGYERDQFARRYYKVVPDPDNPNETSEHVVVFSNPFNMIPKYLYKTDKILQGMSHDDKLANIIDTVKFEIHPVYRIASNVARNLKDNGDPIVWPNEYPPEIAAGFKLGYALKETVKLLDTVTSKDEDDQKQAMDKWRKDAGFLMYYLNQPATFSYLRRPQLIKQGYKLEKMKADLKRAFRRMESRGKLTPQKEIDMFRNFEKAYNKELKKFDDMVKKHDEDLVKSWSKGGQRGKQKRVQETQKVNQPKPPPFISVPSYRPEA